MPEVSQVQRSDVRAAIARASAATGVSFDYMLAQAGLESAFDPAAQAKTSSAAGLYQFTTGTWLETLERHGPRYGLGVATEEMTRRQALDLRFDPGVSALMAAELARDNAAELRGLLGREPDSTELYLAHFLGAGGARTFLSALERDPVQSAAAILPQAASANAAIFHDDGRARSVGEVMDLLRGKLASTLAEDASGGSFYRRAAVYPGGSQPAPGQPQPVSRTPSMAETLATTFGPSAGVPGLGGERVQKAYSAIRAFGL